MNRLERIATNIVVAWTSFNVSRDFFIPKDVEMETIDPQGTDLDIRTWEKNGKLFGMAFAGKQNKPLWHFIFRNENDRKRRIDETISSRKMHMDFKQKRIEEKKQFKHSLKVGDILTSSWGYDQTNVDFYEVTAAGEKSVKIREIASKTHHTEVGSDYVVAVPGHFTGPEMLKIVGKNNSLHINNSQWAYPWDGQPERETAFGYGH
jgi:hypothetical protein